MRKLSLSTVLLGLLVYAAIFFWQVDGSARRAGDAFLERQLWLARQSALLLERQLAAQPAQDPSLEALRLAEGGAGESRLALFDRQGAAFLAAGTDLPLPDQAAAAFAPRLARGGHGSARLPADGGAWLLTYLPLAGGERPLTLVLAAPEAEVVAPVRYLARGQILMHLAVLALAAAFVYGRARRGPEAAPAAEDEATPELDDLRGQCRVLAQENALLGAARREYQLLVEGAEQGLARLNSNGLLLFCSKPLLSLLGRERRELLGRNLLDLDLLVEGREELQRALGRLRDGEAALPVLCTLAGSASGAKRLELRLSPLRVDGEVTGILLQVQEQAVVAAAYLRMSNS
ncbi:hypothetical protein [Geoalkalibacter sp.]|uniref:hypothetical protein n=1 Tax=Geoalkalibacter sp. TaxID=3041440 RepID=UPI00272E1C54|nr:hypothetical protein [Geoalkalibacter sp.]